MTGSTILVKLGGSILQDFLKSGSQGHWICDDLATMRSQGIKLVIVHGGGPAINAELTARGITWEFVEGQRVTTPEMITVIDQVLAGNVNRQIVRILNRNGLPALGLSGVEGNTLFCTAADPRLQQVGVIQEVNTSLIQTVMNSTFKDGKSMIPVIAPIGVGANQEMYNINADWAASRIAQALGIKKLVFLTDQDGIKGKENTVLPALDTKDLEHLVETSVVHGGMLVKTRTILSALNNQVEAVHIVNGSRKNALVTGVFEKGFGTVCYA